MASINVLAKPQKEYNFVENQLLFDMLTVTLNVCFNVSYGCLLFIDHSKCPVKSQLPENVVPMYSRYLRDFNDKLLLFFLIKSNL